MQRPCSPLGDNLFVMEIKMVSYQEIFNLGNYCSQRIGVEVSVNPGEDAKQALEVARNLVHEYHQQTAPEEIQRGTVVRDLEPSLEEMPLIDQIRSCKELKVLESYKLIVRNDEELNNAYRTKLIELSNQDQ